MDEYVEGRLYIDPKVESGWREMIVVLLRNGYALDLELVTRPSGQQILIIEYQKTMEEEE